MEASDTAQIDQLKALLENPESLHPDLAPYLTIAPRLKVPFLNHPLVQSMFHMDSWNALINQQYEQKKLAAAQALKDRNWGRYIFLHERPYRWQALYALTQPSIARGSGAVVGEDEFWELFRDVWIDTENMWQNRTIISILLRRKGSEKIMDNSESWWLSRVLETAETLDVYRGCTGKNKRGYSWTIDKQRAEWFARRFKQKGAWLLEGTVQPKSIIAFINARSEHEVIINPKHVTVVKETILDL